MKAFPFKNNLLVLTLTLLFVLGPGSGRAQSDVKIRGEKIPSDVLHVVDTQFQDPNNGGVQQIQFRDLSLSLDEATELFLSTDPDENLLRLIGETLANDHQVKFRGTVDGTKFEAQVERHDDGTLHARIKGLDISGMAPEQLGEFLSNGFDRLRIRGTDGERFEIRRQDDGTLRGEIKGMNLSGFTAEQLTTLAVDNGFERLRIRGSEGERLEIRRHNDGDLRAKIEGMDLNGYTAEQLTSLAVDNGFDRLRIRGTNGERFEFKRQDDGTLRARIRGMDVSKFSPEQLTNLATEKGLDRLRIDGLAGEKFEIRRQDDGTLRARMEGMDVSGYTPEQLMDLAKEKGLDRLRIRGSDGQRFEIDRKDDGTLRADFRGMDVRAYTQEQLTNLAKERGLDRLRIRGVNKDGNRVRIEYRQDKGIVKWEGAARGVTEVSRRLNNEHAPDRGRDRENKLRDRVERETERFDRGDHRGRGSGRIERAWRERAEKHVRERIERHGGRGRH